MRLTRLLASLIAAAIMIATPLATVTTADASTARMHHAASAEKAKSRKVTIKFAANGAASFRLFGKVSPKGKTRIALVYSASAKGKYKAVKKSTTNKAGKYAFTGLKTEGYYAVLAAGGNGFKAGHSKVEHICRGC